jgi:hypothetical protein
LDQLSKKLLKEKEQLPYFIQGGVLFLLLLFILVVLFSIYSFMVWFLPVNVVTVGLTALAQISGNITVSFFIAITTTLRGALGFEPMPLGGRVILKKGSSLQKTPRTRYPYRPLCTCRIPRGGG